MADRVRARWGEDPERIAAACGVPVINDDDSADYGSVRVFAEYGTRPARIVLYRGAIATVAAWLATPDARHRVGTVSAGQMFIAHELFHHFDVSGESVPIARRWPVRLLSIGPLNWTTGLPSLAEIGAAAFTQSLLALRVPPDDIVRAALGLDGCADGNPPRASGSERMEISRHGRRHDPRG